MKNYLWTADGKFIKKNIIEHLDDGFYINKDDGLCIDDHCITKNDITFLKQQQGNFRIENDVENKNILSLDEAKIFINYILKTIYNGQNNSQKKDRIKKYLPEGWYDNRTGVFKIISDLYIDTLNFDFFAAFITSDRFQVATITLPNEYLTEVKNTGRVILMNDQRLIFTLTTKRIQDIVPQIYYVIDQNYSVMLMKIKYNDIFHWKIVIYTNEDIISVQSLFDSNFQANYKNTIAYIKSVSENMTITDIEFKNFIEEMKKLSIINGLYKFNILKDKIFIKNYNNILNLDFIKDSYFEGLIMNYSHLKEQILNYTQTSEIKIRINVTNMSNVYYKLLYNDNVDSSSVDNHISRSYLESVVQDYILESKLTSKQSVIEKIHELFKVIGRLYGTENFYNKFNKILNHFYSLYSSTNRVNVKFPPELLAKLKTLITYILSSEYKFDFAENKLIKDFDFTLLTYIKNVFNSIKTFREYYNINNTDFYDGSDGKIKAFTITLPPTSSYNLNAIYLIQNSTVSSYSDDIIYFKNDYNNLTNNEFKIRFENELISNSEVKSICINYSDKDRGIISDIRGKKNYYSSFSKNETQQELKVKGLYLDNFLINNSNLSFRTYYLNSNTPTYLNTPLELETLSNDEYLNYGEIEVPALIWAFKTISESHFNFDVQISNYKFINTDTNITIFKFCLVNLIFYYYAFSISKFELPSLDDLLNQYTEFQNKSSSHNSSIPSPIPDELKSPSIISDDEITEFINSNTYLFRILEEGKDMYEWKLLFLRDNMIPF